MTDKPSLFQQLLSTVSASDPELHLENEERTGVVATGPIEDMEQPKTTAVVPKGPIQDVEQPETTAVVPSGPIRDGSPPKSTTHDTTDSNKIENQEPTTHSNKTENQEPEAVFANNPDQDVNPAKVKSRNSTQHNILEDSGASPAICKNCRNCQHCNPTQSSRLEDQAATAALYATNSNNQTGSNNRRGYDILDNDNKLSSAGAAASLRYAQPHDLPSYPSSGLRKGDSAAGAAASIGWSNQKPFEHWKPDPSASASAAAMLAKDYKMAPLWQPEQSSNGAKAALLAHRNGAKVEIWQPEPTEWGNSAATQAMKKGNTLSPQLDYGHTDIGRKGSMLAATGAMSSSRKRAESQPVVVSKTPTYPDEANAVANAMSAATSAHRSDSRRTKVSSEAGAVPYTNMSREMYTSNPPVAPEVDEKNRQDTLRASAVAMAKQMYTVQQKQIDAANHAASGASAAHRRRRSSASSGDEAVPMKLNNLQEAAHKLAQERLAKLHDEHAQNREYRDYYNQDTQVPSSPSRASRMSLRGRARQRASSNGSVDDDRQQSNAIRAQMSIFSNNVNQVDEKKRQMDRDNLMAAAQRNVTKSLQGMDQKVFADTGKVAPSMMSDWDAKAQAAAQAKSDTRMENHGRIHIGGGQFINQSAVDLVAQRNVQPVLDEINEKAAVQRERDAARKAEEELQKKKSMDKKTREREEKAINKQLKKGDKEERKSREAEEKAEKRAEKERRKSGNAAPIPAFGESREEAVDDSSDDDSSDVEEPTTHSREAAVPASSTAPASSAVRTSMEDQASLRMRQVADSAANTSSSPSNGAVAGTDNGKLKSWLRTRLRRSSKPQKPVTSADKVKETESGFVGGAALTGASANNSNVSLGARPSNVTDVSGRDLSVRDVAIASTGTHKPETPDITRGRTVTRAADPVSPLSDRDDEEEFLEARDNFDEDLAPPATFSTSKEPSPARGGKFIEQI